jgi:tRNA threonylcarbamoyladenosine biosynthesis protein TsaE
LRVIDLPDEPATRRLGGALGHLVEPGDVILLIGELGAGKTTLVQALAEAAGVAEPVTSPTFSLMHELSGHQGILFRHMDLYRLEADQLAHLGLEEWFEPDAVLLIEWADRLGAFGPNCFLRIVLSHRGDGRLAEFTASGQRHEELLARLLPGVAI